MPDVQLRLAVPSDISRLMALDHTISSESVWQLELRRDTGQLFATFREVRLPRPIALAYPHDKFALADEWPHKSLVLAAMIEPDPVGYIAIIERSAVSIGWVTDLVVGAQARRRGVASALLAAAQAWAQERGVRRLMLEMQSKNIPAIRLAQKHGYEFCGYNDHYYLTQDVALFFARAVK